MRGRGHASAMRGRAGGAAAALAAAVRDVSTGTGAAGTNVFTLPTRASGDTLVAVVTDDAGSNQSAGTGWTRRINTDDLSSIGLAVYTRQSNGTDGSPLSANAAGAYSYTIFAIRNPVSGYDVSATGNSNLTPSSPIVAPTVSPTGAADVLISAYVRSAGTGTITPPAGQTATTQVNTAGSTLRCGYETLAASGATGTRSATNGTSTDWIGASVAVK